MMFQYHGYLSYTVSVPGLLESHGEHEFCSPPWLAVLIVDIVT
jgi:hypothetical protein